MLSKIYLLQLNKDDKNIKIPKKEETHISATEKLIREEIKKLNENTEEIKRLREEVEEKKNNE